jgi:maltose alpha-D-glucosyltransferase/alpha-amylase
LSTRAEPAHRLEDEGRTDEQARPAHECTRKDSHWYRDAVIYELHVRSFQDSDGDGIGDFRGLTARLPYLQDLGATALWLLPFYPSPLRDDGYDIADYHGIHRDYGTMDDFRRFLDEAHRNGLRVITELVINHTSDQHPWFGRARTAPPGSTERGFYVWSDSPDRYRDARIIFPDFERSNWSWDPVARAYYWHRFYSHQPDLNYDNPAVIEAVLEVVDYWFRLGVDGMRLDAVPYLVEREGTSSENLAATHAIVKRLRAHVDRTYGDRIFIAEANQWPEDAAAYFGEGDESHMVFHFPLMPRLFMAIRQEDRLPILDILAQTPPAPPECQWALFLRNHDELTLEMVTEEERLYMYHVYASEAEARVNLGIRRRLAPLLGNDRRRIELMNALLFSLPGTPVLYYGDEIGMGDNIYLGDRNGVRTPMQWDGERNAGFSSANPQRLFLPLIVDDEYHHQSVHVAQQQANPHSLLSWTKRLIAVRRRYQAFGRGDLLVVDSPNMRVLAFVRRWRDQQILVVMNLSRLAQHAALDLRRFAGLVPVETFGRIPFPAIEDAPYHVMLSPHGVLWLELTPAAAQGQAPSVPLLTVERSWEELLAGRGQADLESVLPAYVERCVAWNSGARTVLQVAIEEAIPAGDGGDRRWLTIVRVVFTSGEPERYLLPLAARSIGRRKRPHPDAVAELQILERPEERWQIVDAAEDPKLARALLQQAGAHAPLRGAIGSLEAVLAPDHPIYGALREEPSRLARARRGSNALVAMGDRVVLKLFRQIESGPNPEIEMRSRLREVGFAHAPALVAGFRWQPDPPARGPSAAWLGIVQERADNQGEAWTYAVEAARDSLRRAIERGGDPPAVASIVPHAFVGAPDEPPLDDVIGPYRETIARLGERAAELHRALATPTSDPAFTPEPLTPFSRRSAYQRMRRSAVSLLEVLRTRAPLFEPSVRALAEAVCDRREAMLAVFGALLERRIDALRIRCHGNFHLGQVLHAGDDLVVVDFDGEPGRPLYERRLKRSPLQDVATMVRSFHYAAHAAAGPSGKPAGASGDLSPWLRAWQRRAGTLFVEAYARSVAPEGLLPSDPEAAQLLLHAFVVERAVYEVNFELNRQGGYVSGPLSDLPLLLE